MHELAVTQNILNLAQRHAQGQQITDLYLVIGQFSSIIDESIRFYWDILAEGTPAAGARLHFQRKTAIFGCSACGGEYSVTEDFCCPTCGSHQVRLLSGNEFFLESIRVAEVEEG
jgi:hydrogenase nickel incorporation protein HypA/HybF